MKTRNVMTKKKATAMARLLVRRNMSAYGANKWNFAWMLNNNEFMTDSAFNKVRRAFYMLVRVSSKYPPMDREYANTKLLEMGGDS